MTSVGIDFGTTNSAVAVWQGDSTEVLPLGRGEVPTEWAFPFFDLLFPSVFGLVESERSFGWDAKLHASENLQAVKRLLIGNDSMDLGGRQFSCRHVAGLLFGALRDASTAVGHSIDTAVVTIPANSTGQARFRTREVARMAGIGVAALINEPTAAAMSYVHDFPDTERVLVYDWGGGTIDATLLEFHDGVFEERASRGIAGLGGIEVDKRLRELLEESIPQLAKYEGPELAQLLLELERTKIRLSYVDSMDEEVPFVTPDGKYEVGVTRRQFQDAVEFIIVQSLRPVRDCIDDAGISEIDIDAVLMVGGSSQIPLVQERLTDLLKTEPVDPAFLEPMTAVSRGAAIAAAALAGEVETAFSVICSHSLGTRTIDVAGNRSFNEIIPRGAPLPYKATKSYTPNKDGQRELPVEVWEGDPRLTLDDDANVLLAELKLQIDPPRKRSEAAFLLEYRYDVDGIVHVTATDQLTKKPVLKDKVDFFAGGLGAIEPEITDIKQTFAEVAVTAAAKRPTPLDVRPARTASRKLRPNQVTLVVDGSNIAHEGRRDRPSYEQLRVALRQLRGAYPDAQVVVVVDANFRHRVGEEEKAAVERALKENRLVSPPAGTVGAADAVILAIADKTGALVVSNDSFKPFQGDYPWIRGGRVIGALHAANVWVFQPRTPPAAREYPAMTPPRPSPSITERLTKADGSKNASLPAGWENSHWWSGE